MTFANLTVNSQYTVNCKIGTVSCPALTFTAVNPPTNASTNSTVSLFISALGTYLIALQRYPWSIL